MIESCALCCALYGVSSQRFENTVLYENQNFVVIPTLGQFEEGWLMVVSKQHSRCAGALTRDLFAELSRVVCAVRSAVEDAYGSSIVFEHGHGQDRYSAAGCCVEHTHLHISPCKSLPTFTSLIPFVKVELRQLIDLTTVDGGNGYLLVGDGDNPEAYSFYPVNTVIPKQFLRQVLATVQGRQEMWDWRSYPCYKAISRTIATMRPEFSRMSRLQMEPTLALQPRV